MASKIQQTLRVMIACSLATCLLSVPASHSRQKRDAYQDIYNRQCHGVYDKSMFAYLDLICDDCYNIFREPSLHGLCRKNCFTSDYFEGCVKVLLLDDELPRIQSYIKQLHGAPVEGTVTTGAPV